MTENELYDTIIRSEVETSSFYLQFIIDPPQKIMKYLVNQNAPVISQFWDKNQMVYGPNLLEYLLKSNKPEKYDPVKLFPTLNVLCGTTLVNWIKLRNIVSEFGSNSIQVVQKSIGFLTAIEFYYDLIVMLYIFQLLTPIYDKKAGIIFVLMYDIITFTFYQTNLLQKAAELNYTFVKHQQTLLQLKDIISTVYMQLQLNDQNQIMHILENIQSEHYLYKQVFQLIHLETLKYGVKGMLNNLKIIIDSINNNIKQLELQQKYNPFKLLGLDITYDLIYKFMAFNITIIFTVGSRYLYYRLIEE
ncbi:hypothetical protein PPERSA_01386 [Pseudocohnilembus persalinus]|uniref:Transmembrane protein n=1 Tax=Pseudocohnilembus persalinus TaxID=266149 RepID=A0A0V0QH08_PSEPJ|nr:hypothetical protein PPERSA_01386 [Pseudocohnilembus persalinus]|eukprot:KRX01483.1 hypothetical protein PPERSA_01386 [Pseudocohnilembus persalinus]